MQIDHLTPQHLRGAVLAPATSIGKVGAATNVGDTAGTYPRRVAETRAGSKTPACAVVASAASQDALSAADTASIAACVSNAATAEAGTALDAASGEAFLITTTNNTLSAQDAASGPTIYSHAVQDLLSAMDAGDSQAVLGASTQDALAAVDAVSATASSTHAATVAEIAAAQDGTMAGAVMQAVATACVCADGFAFQAIYRPDMLAALDGRAGDVLRLIGIIEIGRPTR